MKPLQNKVNTQTPDADFPFGDLTDDNGTGNGTPANRELFSDSMQFFEKMMSEAGITPNGVLDNEYNGWQLWKALLENMPKKYVYTYTSIIDGATEVISRATIEAAFAESIPFYKGFGATTNDLIDFQIQVWYKDTGTWKLAQVGTSVEPIISVNGTTGNVTIVLNGAPVSPAFDIRVVFIG